MTTLGHACSQTPSQRPPFPLHPAYKADDPQDLHNASGQSVQYKRHNLAFRHVEKKPPFLMAIVYVDFNLLITMC